MFCADWNIQQLALFLLLWDFGRQAGFCSGTSLSRSRVICCRKLGHWERALRELASKALAALVPTQPQLFAEGVLDRLLPMCLDGCLEASISYVRLICCVHALHSFNTGSTSDQVWRLVVPYCCTDPNSPTASWCCNQDLQSGLQACMRSSDLEQCHHMQSSILSYEQARWLLQDKCLLWGAAYGESAEMPCRCGMDPCWQLERCSWRCTR